MCHELLIKLHCQLNGIDQLFLECAGIVAAATVAPGGCHHHHCQTVIVEAVHEFGFRLVKVFVILIQELKIDMVITILKDWKISALFNVHMTMKSLHASTKRTECRLKVV